MEIFFSKSKYINYINCPKYLWLDKHKKEVKEIVPYTVAEEGILIGKMAHSLFPGIKVITSIDNNLSKMVTETQKNILSADYIAEASFFYKNNYCAVDILEKNADGTFNINEVKSSSSAKTEFYYDIAYQKYVLEGNGYQIKNCNLILINSQYVLNNVVEPRDFFVSINVNEKIKKINVLKDLEEAEKYVCQEEEPTSVLKSYCEKYDGCPFKKYCYKNRNAETLTLYNCRNRFNFVNEGLTDFKSLLNSKQFETLTDIQKRQILFTVNNINVPFIDTKKINSFLEKIQFPIYFLDFETELNLIPKYQGTKPYQQITFQYSLHILHKNGSLEHKEFLKEPGNTFINELAVSLCKDLKKKGTIIAYNKSFEMSRIKELATMIPDLEATLVALLDRFMDLADMFQNGYYYNKRMGGSFSIKSVLPALFPDDEELNYHNLNQIHNGSEAMISFQKLIDTSFSINEREELKKNMLKYCQLDTFAMVKIYYFLKNLQ